MGFVFGRDEGPGWPADYVPRVAPPTKPKAHQREIREDEASREPRPVLVSTDGCWVEKISVEDATAFIVRYEWLGTMGTNTRATYGMRAPDGELIGVAVFGWPGAIQSRDICGPMVPDESDKTGKREKSVYRELAICLERGACAHFAPPNAASFLISRAVKLAAADHDWRIFYAYADQEAGEIGTVYQACNWLYIGQGVGRESRNAKHQLRQDWYIPDEDRIIASRTLRARRPRVTINQAKRNGWLPVYREPKHKYVHFEGNRTERKALRAALRPCYSPRPYPKRAGNVLKDL